ncbi:MAG: lactate utilization protein [Deltaproteobacteria bacterium]|nr:lactate utilization protein [Deltaproteobacteria bacterium]
MIMESGAREEILGRLRKVPRSSVGDRPEMPPLKELSLGREEMIATFTGKLTAEEGVVHRVGDGGEAVARLTEIAAEEKLERVMVSADEVIAPLDLPRWGKERGIEILTPADFSDRDSFRDAVFDDAQAGITGADYAVAESGTLVIAHDARQPRLVSLAPVLHIALVPVERMVAVYEQAVEKMYGDGGEIPSQVSFITGPSMTADIQGRPFKGMHGPRRLVVILIG